MSKIQPAYSRAILGSRRFLHTSRNTISVPLIIDGQDVVTNDKLQVDFNGKSLYDVSLLNIATKNQEAAPTGSKLLQQITTNSREGFKEWSSWTYQEQSKVLTKAAHLLRKNREEIVQSHVEIGCAPGFAEFLLENGIQHLEEYTSQLSRPHGIIPKSGSALALAIRQPLGPVLSLTTWNAPTVLGLRCITAPLAAGCSVILKSSHRAPLTPYLLVKCFLEAGVPSKALQLVHVDSDQSPAFLEETLKTGIVRKLNFTGSTEIGSQIAQTAAKHLVPSLLELGGKNYSIIEKDADVERAAFSTLVSSWTHKGQICMCIDKVYVHESKYDEFKTALLSSAEQFLSSYDSGLPSRDTAIASKIVDLVEQARGNGAKIVYPENPKLESISYPPTIIEGVEPTMDIDTIESFGPVVALYRYSDADTLVDSLNEQEPRLKATIWSANVVRAIAIAKRVEAGGVHINSVSLHDDATTPHGGVKGSGMGRFNSTWGLDEFSYVKTITVDE